MTKDSERTLAVKRELAEITTADENLTCASMALQGALLYCTTAERKALSPALNAILTVMRSRQEAQHADED